MPHAKPWPGLVTDEALMLLHQIAADVRALRAAFERKQPRGRQDSNAAEIAELLRLIAGAFGDAPFTAAELWSRALNPLWPENPRKLGKLLARIEGRDFGGLHVSRIGEEAAGAIWKVSRV